MNLASFEIKNYKSIEHIVVPDCPSMTIFVGRNSSGKTSVFDAIKYITFGTNAQDVLSLREKIHAGVDSYVRKDIWVKFLFIAPDTNRIDYLMHFLDLEKELSEKMLETQLLRKIEIELSINVPGSEVPENCLDRRVLPKSMFVSNSKGELIPFIHEIQTAPQGQEPRGIISLVPFIQSPSIKTRNIEEIDAELTKKLGRGVHTTVSQVFSTQYLSGRIFLDIRNSIKFFQSIRESQKRIGMAFQTDVGERGSNLVTSMDTLFRRDHARFVRIVEKCMAIFPDIVNIHPDPLPANEVPSSQEEIATY